MPEAEPFKSVAGPLAQRVSGGVRQALFVLACAVGVVMLIVCAETFESAIGAVGQGNGVAGRVRSRTFPAAATDAHGKRQDRLLGALLGLALAVTMAHLRKASNLLARKHSHRRDALLFTLLAAVHSRRALWPAAGSAVAALSLREGIEEGGRRIEQRRAACLGPRSAGDPNSAFACILLVGAGS